MPGWLFVEPRAGRPCRPRRGQTALRDRRPRRHHSDEDGCPAGDSTAANSTHPRRTQRLSSRRIMNLRNDHYTGGPGRSRRCGGPPAHLECNDAHDPASRPASILLLLRGCRRAPSRSCHPGCFGGQILDRPGATGAKSRILCQGITGHREDRHGSSSSNTGGLE